MVHLVAHPVSEQVLDGALALDEGGDDLGVEVGGRTLQDFRLRVLEGARRPIGTIGRHGVDRVGDRQDARPQRNLVGPQLIRVAIADTRVGAFRGCHSPALVGRVGVAFPLEAPGSDSLEHLSSSIGALALHQLGTRAKHEGNGVPMFEASGRGANRSHMPHAVPPAIE